MLYCFEDFDSDLAAFAPKGFKFLTVITLGIANLSKVNDGSKRFSDTRKVDVQQRRL